jgi:hypothetical protein
MSLCSAWLVNPDFSGIVANPTAKIHPTEIVKPNYVIYTKIEELLARKILSAIVAFVESERLYQEEISHLKRTWHMQSNLKSIPLVVVSALITIGSFARVYSDPLSLPGTPGSEFKFVRVVYSSAPAMYRGYGYMARESWRVDWPDAENHFLQGLRRLTRVDASAQGKLLSLTDEEIFDYPWLYILEVGSWVLEELEIQHLREYLLRGGFLMIDDFHGSREWAGFMSTMRQVFPNRPVQEITGSDEVYHVFYDLDNRIQIPGIHTYWSGNTFEKDGVTPHWRGIYDDDGRLMVAINFNMDIGDAWEHADHPYYPEPMTALAYRFGINYVIYSMTH